jgi:hypothetical protein
MRVIGSGHIIDIMVPDNSWFTVRRYEHALAAMRVGCLSVVSYSGMAFGKNYLLETLKTKYAGS